MRPARPTSAVIASKALFLALASLSLKVTCALAQTKAQPDQVAPPVPPTILAAISELKGCVQRRWRPTKEAIEVGVVSMFVKLSREGRLSEDPTLLNLRVNENYLEASATVLRLM